MAITVGTNSYISVADTTTYFAARLYADDWTSASDGDKEKALLMARRLLDQQEFLGCRTSDDQLLAWPRSGVRGVDSSAVPAAVIDAQCELALAFLRDDLTADDSNRGVRRMKAGSVELEYDGRAPAKGLPDAVTALLQSFLATLSSASSVQLVF